MIRMERLPAVLLFLLIFVSGHAQQTHISGKAPSYAGTKLEFLQTGDWITGQEDVIGSCIVSGSGDFSLWLDMKTTRQVMVHLGIYLGYFFAEQGKTYQLVLPERVEKTPEDKLNPYFQE